MRRQHRNHGLPHLQHGGDTSATDNARYVTWAVEALTYVALVFTILALLAVLS